MKSPWKFITNLALRRRTDESSPEEEPEHATDAKQLQAPASDHIDEPVAADPTTAVETASVENEPVDNSNPDIGQDDIAADISIHEASDDDQKLTPDAAAEQPASGTDANAELAAEPGETVEPVEAAPTATVPSVSVDDRTVNAKDNDQQLATLPIADVAALTSVKEATVELSPPKNGKAPATIPADQQFLMNMRTVDAEIKELRLALAKKLREQNAQLRHLIDRY